jgi:hypothetical protein
MIQAQHKTWTWGSLLAFQFESWYIFEFNE